MKKLLASLCLLSLGTCSYFQAPVITIRNDSPVILHNISLIGTGFTETIPSLQPGKVISVTVRPHGESGLEIQFDSPQGRITKGDLAYIEASGGYKVTITVNEKFEVISKSALAA
jgi:hypothetical protein